MSKEIAKITIDLERSEHYREAICAWLHEKAEEIKNLDKSGYVKKPSWSFFEKIKVKNNPSTIKRRG